MPKRTLSYSRLRQSCLEALEGRLLLAGIVSDDFNGASLDTSLWTLVDPVGDSMLNLDGAHALLGVPAGVDHSVWNSGNKSARLMQPAANEDLGVEVKFDSQPSGVYAQQGLIIEQNDGNFLRFDFYSNAQGLNLFAASFVNGSPTKRLKTRVALGATMYMRVERQGDAWTLRYSDDGEVWRQGVSFTHSLGVTRVGVFAGNEGSSPPAHTAAIDYFRSLADPVPPPDENQPPVAGNDSAATFQSQPVIVRVLDNDADPDGTLDPATVTIVTPPANGLLQVDPQSGAVTYAPISGFIGSDSFIYTVRDDLGLVSNQATVNIQVTAESPPQQGPTIDIWHNDEQTFGLPGRAQRWVNILGNVQDPDGIASLTYSLNGGAAQQLSIGADRRRLVGAGDFNVEIDAGILLATNELVIRAVDTTGAETVRNVIVHWVAGTSWPSSYSVDWSQVTDIQSAVQVVDGLWHLTPQGIRTSAVGYDRLLAVGDWTWQDCEIVVPFTVHGYTPPPYNWQVNEPGIGMVLRWPGHSENAPYQPGQQPRVGWEPNGAVALYRYNKTDPTLPGTANFTIVNGITYYFKATVKTLSTGYRYELKIWEASQSENAAVFLYRKTMPLDDLAAGSVLLVAHRVDVTFGNVTITRAGETVPPAISNVVAQPSPDGARISWSTNEPATGRVEYGLTTDYELGVAPVGTAATSHSVQLSGLNPEAAYHYRIIATDAAGNSSSSADAVFTTAALDTVPPLISQVQHTTGVTTLIVSFSTSEPAAAMVEYGPTADYGASVHQSLLSTGHSISLTGLVPGTLYHFRIIATDSSGNASTSGDFTAITSTSAGAIRSDDFGGTGLDESTWTLVDPVGDATVAFDGTHVLLGVPAGVDHSVWSAGNRAARLMQAAANTDFEIEAKFDSIPSGVYAQHGIVVEADPLNFLRFDFYSSSSGLTIFAASFVNGSPTKRIKIAVPPSAARYMRVRRAGDLWTLLYSLDGQNWTTAGSFIQAMAVTQVGVFVGNEANRPAYTAAIDYFINTAAPLATQD